LVLAILLATPVFGALSISLVQHTVGDTNLIDLNYAGADPCNLPRAFGLNVEVNTPVLITAVSGYKTDGESTAASKGFGIFPAKIVIEANGNVLSWGTPLADEVNDPGAAGTGLGTSKVVLEFGSLYFGDTNAPATSGTLCTLKVACNGSTSAFNVTATEEDTYRGGIVYEDGTAPSPNLSAALLVSTLCAPPCPSKATTPVPANGSTTATVDANLTWTAGTNATSHDVYFGTANPPTAAEFKGNQAGTLYNPPGNMNVSTTYYWRIDERNSGCVTAGDVWSFTTDANCFPRANPKFADWVLVGKPSCWCSLRVPRQCYGDADGKAETKSNYWVYTNDLAVLSAAWQKTFTQIKGKTGGTTTVVQQICADFDHTAETKSNYRVYTGDLAIMSANWQKAGKPDANCAVFGH
jgi:hypothetical protein